MDTLRNLFQSVISSIPNIEIMDIIDILVVTFMIYKLIGLIRNTSAYRVVKGIALLLIITLLTEMFRLNTVNFILGKVLELGAVAIVVVFQPELRRMLESVGSQSIGNILSVKDKRSETDAAIEATVTACEILSRERIGALIVFERSSRMNDFFKTGTILDAKISPQLLRSIFYPKNALHDGAVIVQQNRIAAAGCVLPLTQNTHISSDLGMRHRAGIGMSEVSDSVVVIVSEETGTISVAVGGMLKRHLAPQMLERLLKSELMTDESEPESGLIARIRKFIFRGGKQNEEG